MISHLSFRIGFASLTCFLTLNVSVVDGQTSGTYFSEPIPGLNPTQSLDFTLGMELFTHFFGPDDGLGPAFNEHSCATCHAIPLAGGAGLAKGTFVQQKPNHSNATGGAGFARFVIAQDGLTQSRIKPHLQVRRPPSLHGLGFLDHISSETILENADPDDLDGDGISGRHGGVDGEVGRFGWKASVATVADFNAQALINEHGITTNAYPDDGSGTSKIEFSDQQMHQINTFVGLLATPPASNRSDPTFQQGEEVFEVIGCAACHTPSYTVPNFPIPDLNGVEIFPYSDFLLHDMGPDLADGIREGIATGYEFRTPPLWGLKYLGPPYLHDGRADSLDAAILLHGGEATQSVTRFKALSSHDMKWLTDFLNSI